MFALTDKSSVVDGLECERDRGEGGKDNKCLCLIDNYHHSRVNPLRLICYLSILTHFSSSPFHAPRQQLACISKLRKKICTQKYSRVSWHVCLNKCVGTVGNVEPSMSFRDHSVTWVAAEDETLFHPCHAAMNCVFVSSILRLLLNKIKKSRACIDDDGWFVAKKSCHKRSKHEIWCYTDVKCYLISFSSSLSGFSVLDSSSWHHEDTPTFRFDVI